MKILESADKRIKVLVSKNGTEFWVKNNLLHRENGPAIIRKDGFKKWYLNGKFIRSNW